MPCNQPYLSSSEEDELVQFLLRCANTGYAWGRKEVIAIAQRHCNSRGLDVQVTHGWLERFCQRHPTLSLRTTAPLSQARMRGSDTEALHTYFDMLEHTLSSNELADKPCQIYNMDETGMPLDPKAPKLVCRAGSRNPVSISSGDRSQITVVGCVSAGGICIPVI